MKISAFVLVVCAVASIAASSSSAAARRTPQALYSALLTKTFPDSQLPSGFTNAKVSLETPSSSGRHYRVVGEVSVAVDGPDPDDGMGFDVFPSHADTLGDLNHPTFAAGEKLHIVAGGVPGFPKLPGHMWIGSVTGKNALGKTITDGVTIVGIVQGNVLIQAYTDSADNSSSGNVPAALQLLHAALRHLTKV